MLHINTMLFCFIAQRLAARLLSTMCVLFFEHSDYLSVYFVQGVHIVYLNKVYCRPSVHLPLRLNKPLPSPLFKHAHRTLKCVSPRLDKDRILCFAKIFSLSLASKTLLDALFTTAHTCTRRGFTFLLQSVKNMYVINMSI